MTVDVVNSISGAITALAALLAVAVAYWQLRNLNRTLRLNGLTAMLGLEAEMNSRKAQLDEIIHRLERQHAKDPHDVEELHSMVNLQQSYLENYLNAVDRLAYCILNRFAPSGNWKGEYRTYISRLVTATPDRFGPNTPYRNIVALHKYWQSN